MIENTIEKLFHQCVSSATSMSIREVKRICKGYSDTQIKEATELAIYRYVRNHVIDTTLSFSEKYVKICSLYAMQCNLAMRTSQSIMLQQYSTPIPIAYLASYFVLRNSPLNHFFEPSAGNGFLTLALPRESTIVNELDELRNDNLHKIGFKQVQKDDACQPLYVKEFGGVLTNPPFGRMDTEVNFGAYSLGSLDHCMAAYALEAMLDNGAAAIIIGGHTEYDASGRIKSGKNRVFLSYLYYYYNVEDILNIDGKLYSRQGTSFPIRLILIHGRKQSPGGYPPLGKKNVIHTFEELYRNVLMHLLPTTIQALQKRLTAMGSVTLEGPYRPASTPPVLSLHTNVPDSMDYEIHSAVNQVKEEVGSINEYVREYLGYSTEEELARALS